MGASVQAITTEMHETSPSRPPFADAVATHYKQLIRRGVPQDAALQLSRDYQRALMRTSGLDSK